MEEVTIRGAIEAIISYGGAFWTGVIAGIIVFALEIVLCVKGVIFAGGEKKIEQAKKAGNMLTATRIKCWYKDRDSDDRTINRRYTAVYEYYAGSKRKTKRIVSTGMEPANTITLYYTKSPEKAFSEGEVSTNPLTVIIYILPLLVAYFVATALGYEF